MSTSEYHKTISITNAFRLPQDAIAGTRSTRLRLRLISRLLIILVVLLLGEVAKADCDKDCCKGSVLFNSTDTEAKLSLLASSPLSDRKWTSIVSGQFTADRISDLFFYDKERRTGQFFKLENTVFLSFGSPYSSSGNSWDIVVPGKFGAHNHADLFFYDREAGIAAFAITDGYGNLLVSKILTGLRTTWDLIIPGQFGGDSQTDLFFYDRAAGLGQFFISEGESRIGNGSGGSGPISVYPSLRTTWTLIIPGQFGGDGFTDLLFYDRADGTGQFYISDGLGNIGDGKGGSGPFADYSGGLSKTWDLIIPGNFGSQRPLPRGLVASGLTDLLFYDRGAGKLEFWGLDSVGNIFQFSDYPAVTGWQFIVPGIFKPRLSPIVIPCEDCLPDIPPVIRPLEDLFFMMIVSARQRQQLRAN